MRAGGPDECRRTSRLTCVEPAVANAGRARGRDPEP